ncbi:MAG: hypothetical protein IKK41_00690 [Oscillospiraceae bacterium]|nr:hypothetical protein [Oscillospiraceae bacterium]
MDLRKIADNLGISNYPADLEQATPMDVCDLNLIEHIHKEYNIFREHYEDVINGAKALKNDPDRYIWAQYACGYMLDLSLAAAKKFPLPVDEGVGDILPLLIHLPMIPICVEVYRARGFSDETIKEMMASYYDFAKSIFHKTGTFGLDLRFHRWMLTYAKSLIFPYMGFNIEVLTFPEGALVLKNKENAKVLPLIYNEAIHQSGNILGSAGFEVGVDAPIATVRETGDGFYGFAARNNLVSPQEEFFPKDKWECAIRPGDHVLSVHLPKGMDLTPSNVDTAFRTVIEKAALWFPGNPIKGLYCGSWLLDPTLGELIGKGAKIALFGDRFVRWPIRSDGQEVFRFVFSSKPDDLKDLPENTRLEKGLKNLYLSGGFIREHRGVIL